MQKKVIEVKKKINTESTTPYVLYYEDRNGSIYNCLSQPTDSLDNIELKLVEEFTTVVKSQSYLIEYNYMSDGTLQVSRTNNGFTAIELLGVVTKTQQDILKQISGEMTQPDIVKRTVIKE